jgi:hypothetical protein
MSASIKKILKEFMITFVVRDFFARGQKEEQRITHDKWCQLITLIYINNVFYNLVEKICLYIVLLCNSRKSERNILLGALESPQGKRHKSEKEVKEMDQKTIKVSKHEGFFIS